MEHSEAIQTMAAEKYLLGDLALEAREAFEEHFFGCQECALDVRTGDTFVEYSKIILAEPPAARVATVPSASPTRGWLGWVLRPAFAIPAMAMLLVLLGYQNFVTFPRMENTIASAREPQILPRVYLAAGQSRGAIPIIVTNANQPFLVALDIPWESRFTSYICELYSPDNQLEWSLPVSAEAAKSGIPLLISPKRWTSGQYHIVVRGNVANEPGKQIEIGQQPSAFELRLQQ
jgi:hypothetical protein